MKNKLTIMVPEKNRHQFLRRLLDYFALAECEFEIVIADSSDESYQEICGEFPSVLNIRYVRFQPAISPYDKLMQTIEAISSDYLVMTGDDDFLSLAALRECVSFLDREPGFSLAHGRAWSIVVDSNTGAGDVTPYPQSSIKLDKSGDRVISHLAAYAPTAYSVHRTRHFYRAMASTLRAVKRDDYQFGELLLSCIPVCMGKVHCLDVDYLLRQGHLASTSSRQLTWSEEMETADFDERYSKFISELAAYIGSSDGLADEAARNVVSQAMNEYFSRFVPGYDSVSGRPRPMPAMEQSKPPSIIDRVIGRCLRLFQAPSVIKQPTVNEKTAVKENWFVDPNLILAQSLVESFPEGVK